MDNKKPALAGLGGRMKAVLVGFLLLAPTGYASAGTNAVHDDIQQMLSQKWKTIGSSGSSTFAYNADNVLYDSSGASVTLKTTTPLSGDVNRQVYQVGLLPCRPNGPVPHQFLQTATIGFTVTSDHRAAIDPSYSEPMGSPPVAVDIEEGSPLDVVARDVCARESSPQKSKKEGLDDIYRELDKAKTSKSS